MSDENDKKSKGVRSALGFCGKKSPISTFGILRPSFQLADAEHFNCPRGKEGVLSLAYEWQKKSPSLNGD